LAGRDDCQSLSSVRVGWRMAVARRLSFEAGESVYFILLTTNSASASQRSDYADHADASLSLNPAYKDSDLHPGGDLRLLSGLPLADRRLSSVNTANGHSVPALTIAVNCHSFLP
jgi:hypothetical protein